MQSRACRPRRWELAPLLRSRTRSRRQGSRRRRWASSRSTRLSPRRRSTACASSGSSRRASTRTAARSRSATRSAARARGRSRRCFTSCTARASALASCRCASARGWAPRPFSSARECGFQSTGYFWNTSSNHASFAGRPSIDRCQPANTRARPCRASAAAAVLAKAGLRTASASTASAVDASAARSPSARARSNLRMAARQRGQCLPCASQRLSASFGEPGRAEPAARSAAANGPPPTSASHRRKVLTPTSLGVAMSNASCLRRGCSAWIESCPAIVKRSWSLKRHVPSSAKKRTWSASPSAARTRSGTQRGTDGSWMPTSTRVSKGAAGTKWMGKWVARPVRYA
mmetsp:Transcript_6733/g.21233  ORF Transcript_6733/g.21233 Transcript_6733/m.21233 type:complete len:346 (-) Transcript_6733:342-1379(-)